MFSGIVFFSPVVSSISVTVGCGAAGAAGAAPPGVGAGALSFFAVLLAGCAAFSRMLDPEPPPASRVCTIESVNDVIMNSTAEPVVSLESSVAEPRGPNAVCDPMPPKAPAKSAAFPL